MTTSSKLWLQAILTTALAAANLTLLYAQYTPVRNVLTGDAVSIMFSITALLLTVVAVREIRRALMRRRQQSDQV